LRVKKSGANLLLDVPPDKRGVIPGQYIKALSDIKRNI